MRKDRTGNSQQQVVFCHRLRDHHRRRRWRSTGGARPENFSVFCNHVLTRRHFHILQSPEIRQLGALTLDGFIGLAHVSTVIGSRLTKYR
jgi:hypothetical protein